VVPHWGVPVHAAAGNKPLAINQYSTTPHETGIIKIPLPEGLADVRGGSSHIHTRVISPCKGEYAAGFMCDRPRRHEPVLAGGGVNRFH
jgi:hypothetical protein